MTLRIEDILFGPLPDESPADTEKRVRAMASIVERALDTADGHELVNMLLEARNPVLSRFGVGRTVEEAAFCDGQADVIGFLLMHGTSLGIAKNKQTK